MSERVDHRRAVAERNAAAIVDAAERMLADGTSPSMAAIAAAAGVSRPTLYAHFKTLPDVVEAAVERAVASSVAVVEAAEPDRGPADEALERMLAASWRQIARFDALGRAAAEHLGPGAMHRTHAPLMRFAQDLVVRGQRDGVFRTDLGVDWLVTALFSLVHAADEHARTHEMSRADALEMLTATVSGLLAPPGSDG